MSIISYFPKANKMKRDFPSFGDVITVRSMNTTSTGTTASYYSGDHLLSTTSYTFSSIKAKITAVYLPECLTIGSNTLNNAASLAYVSLPKCTYISSSAFYNCDLLQTVKAPQCITVSTGAFNACNNLESVYFPSCTYVAGSAFRCDTTYSNTSPRTVYMPECTSVGASAFQSNYITGLTMPKLTNINSHAFESCYIIFSSIDVHFPSCTSISSYAFNDTIFEDSADTGNLNLHFSNCTFVGTYAFASGRARFVWFDNCTSLGTNAFDGNMNLTDAYFPKLSSIPAYAFRSTQLNDLQFPSCTYIAAGAFADTNGHYPSFPLCETIVGSTTSVNATFRTDLLTTISFPKLTLISNAYVFAGCTRLMSIYLMNSVVCTLSTTSAFSYTPITNSTYTGTFGSIYVPASLLASYKAASNWKTISARLVGI